MRKRIGWDLRCLPSDGSSGAGIPHAARELWSACLVQAEEMKVDLFAFVSGKAMLDPEGGVVRLSSPRSSVLREGLRAHPVDLLFCPSGSVPYGLSLPAVPWIHDLAIFQHPEWFPESWWQRLFTTTLVRRGIRRAPCVFTVSEATKKEVLALTSYRSNQIIVTGQGIVLPEQQGILPVSLQETPYALILGTVEPRKNISFVQALWSDICARLSQDLPLVIAGRTGWGKEVSTHEPTVRRLPVVSDADRLALLCHASVVLVPSLYEGFGRVAAEALVVGTPVIASDRGALPEIVGHAGQCLPLNSDRWIKAIVDIIRPGPIRNYWIQQTRIGSNHFSWDLIAKQVLANLKENC